MGIQKLLQVTYNDFKNLDIIDPEEFDQNNQDLVGKIDELVEQAQYDEQALLNLFTITAEDAQDLLEHKSNKNNPHEVTAEQLGVYTKTELDPYLSGGDTVIKEEIFTIVSSDNGDQTFTYSNSDSENVIGTLTAEGYQVFTLEDGTYALDSNHIEILIGDTLRRSKKSGGLIEIDDTHVALTVPEGNGAEITIKYFERIGLMGEHAITHEEGGADTISGLVQVGGTQPTKSIWFKFI